MSFSSFISMQRHRVIHFLLCTVILVGRVGEMIPEVGGGRGLGLGSPRGNGSPSVSKGPKPPIQLLQLLKNSPREVKGPIFVIYWFPPGPTQEMELMEPGGEGPSRSPPPVSPTMLVGQLQYSHTNHQVHSYNQPYCNTHTRTP